MTEDVTEHGDGPLRALGRVEPPRPAVLEAAREALWSAVAAEMLATQPPGGSRTGRSAGPEHKRRHQGGPGS